MKPLQARSANHFDIAALTGAIDLEGYVRAIEAKPAEGRSGFENQVLSLYKQANKEGTAFCKNQLFESLKETVRANPILSTIAASVVIVLLFKKFG